MDSHSSGKLFSQDDKFWDNYTKGRPQVPKTFFDRIFDYHMAQSGIFGTVHDVGAGNGPFARTLRSRFEHVIVSDVVQENVELARQKNEGSGFSFRVAKVEDVNDLPSGSVDMVFATNVMHFPEPQDLAMQAIAKQLRPGGTFVAALFGPARFYDAKLQDLWARISHEGGRQLLKSQNEREEDGNHLIRVMARTQDKYNVAPLDPGLFMPGALRINLNMGEGGIQGMLPPEEAHRNVEPSYLGPNDIEINENDDAWSFTTGLAGIKEHFQSFPFISSFPSAFKNLFQELEELVPDGQSVQGYFPVKIILATRR